MKLKKKNHVIALGLAAQLIPLTAMVTSVSAYADALSDDSANIQQYGNESIEPTNENVFDDGQNFIVTIEGGKGEARYDRLTHTIEYKLTVDGGKTLGESCELTIPYEHIKQLALTGDGVNFDDNGNCTNISDDYIKFSLPVNIGGKGKTISFKRYQYNLKAYKDGNDIGFKLDWNGKDIIISRNNEWEERPENEAAAEETITFKNIGDSDFTISEPAETIYYDVELPEVPQAANYTVEFESSEGKPVDKAVIGRYFYFFIIPQSGYCVREWYDSGVFYNCSYIVENGIKKYSVGGELKSEYLKDGRIIITPDFLNNFEVVPYTTIKTVPAQNTNIFWLPYIYEEETYLTANEYFECIPIPKRGYKFADDVTLEFRSADSTISTEDIFGTFNVTVPELNIGNDLSELTVSKDAEEIENYDKLCNLEFEIDLSEVENSDKIKVTTDLQDGEKVAPGDWVIVTVTPDIGYWWRVDAYNDLLFFPWDFDNNTYSQRIAVQVPENVENTGGKYTFKLPGNASKTFYSMVLDPYYSSGENFIVMKGNRLIKNGDSFVKDTKLNIFSKTGNGLSGVEVSGGVLKGNEFTVFGGYDAIKINAINNSNNILNTFTVFSNDLRPAVKAVNNCTESKNIKVSDNMLLTIDKNNSKDINIYENIYITEQNTADKPPVKADNSTVRGRAVKSFKASNAGKTTAVITLKYVNGGLANIYRTDSNNNSVFVDTCKILDGKITVQLDGDGQYFVMTGKYSDLKGDADNNGKINAKDAVELLKHISKIKDAENSESSIIDFNGDGKVNAKDAVGILKETAGLRS